MIRSWLLVLTVLAAGCDLDREAPRPPGRPAVLERNDDEPTRRAPARYGGEPAVVGEPSLAGTHLLLGAPRDASPQDDLLLFKPQFVVSYNRFRNGPNWVAWRLTAGDLGTVGRTQRTFSPDPDLPPGLYRVHHRDYAGSGYDHGHLCPSAERTATPEDNAATFLTTNIVPQRHAINAGAWESLERWSVAKAREGWNLFIIAGGRWDPTCATDLSAEGNVPSAACPTVGRSPDPARRVPIPISTWKVIVLVPAGRALDAVSASTPVVAVEMPNDAGSGTGWQRYVVSVDALEASTGYDFLPLVPRDVQARIESQPYTGR